MSTALNFNCTFSLLIIFLGVKNLVFRDLTELSPLISLEIRRTQIPICKWSCVLTFEWNMISVLLFRHAQVKKSNYGNFKIRTWVPFEMIYNSLFILLFIFTKVHPKLQLQLTLPKHRLYCNILVSCGLSIKTLIFRALALIKVHCWI